MGRGDGRWYLIALMAVHGRYTIVGKLADGGMAEIFLALQNGIEASRSRWF